MTSIYTSKTGRDNINRFYDTLLKDWHKPFERLTLSTTYGDTFVLCSGEKSAPALVLLHGSSSNSAMWKEDVKDYSKQYRVYSIDIIGECGRSSENRPTWKSDDYSNWLNEVFAILAIEKASLIGCSLGGWIALDFAIKHRDKVNKLILLATAGITQVRASIVPWLMITSIAGKWGLEKLNQLVYGNADIDKTALEFAHLLKKYYKPRTDVLPIFTDSELQRLQNAVLFIGGENDCFYKSKATALRLEENVRSVKTVVLPDTGHVLIHQAGRIIDFLVSKK